MARARNIKPGFFANEELAELPMAARLLFIGLWTLADREGRLEDRPKRIKAQIFPYDDNLDVDQLLNDLFQNKQRFILRYKIGEDSFIQISNFAKHQKPHANESESAIPAIPATYVFEESTCDQGSKDLQPGRKALGSDCLNADCLNPHSPKAENPPSPLFVLSPQSSNPKSKTEIELAIDEIAVSMHARHPRYDGRCDLGVEGVKKKLRAIANRKPASQRLGTLRHADDLHKALCDSQKWRDDGMAKALSNWLAPTEGRYEQPLPEDIPKRDEVDYPDLNDWAKQRMAEDRARGFNA